MFNRDIQRRMDVWWTEQRINEIVDPDYQRDKSIERVRRDELEEAVRNQMSDELWNDGVRTILRELADYSNKKGGVCLLGGQISLATQERYYPQPYDDVNAVKRALVDRLGYPLWEGDGPEIGQKARIDAIARLVKASPINAIWGTSDLELIKREVEAYYWEQRRKWEERKKQKQQSSY